eukprot:tig00000981_g5855.t1
MAHALKSARANSVVGSEESSARDSQATSSAALFGMGEAARARSLRPVFQETIFEFGVVAVMSKGSQRKLRWALLETVIVSAQFLLFPLQFYSWAGFDAAEPVRRAFRLIIPVRINSLPFPAFTAIFWSSVALVLLVLAAASYVGYAFANQDFRFMWPLKFLRFAVANVVGLLYMPLISVFSTSFNCPSRAPAPTATSPSRRPRVLGHHARTTYPVPLQPRPPSHKPFLLISRPCLRRPLLQAHGDVAAGDGLLQGGPGGEREYFSRPHSRVDAAFFLNKSAPRPARALPCAHPPRPHPPRAPSHARHPRPDPSPHGASRSEVLSVVVNLEAVPRLATAVLLLASGALYSFLLLEFYPYHRLACNATYTGVAFLFTWGSLACVVDAAVGAERAPGLHVALLAGAAPAALGAAASWAKFRLRMCTADTDIVARIKRPLHVEIATRFLYEAGPGDEEAAGVGEAIFRAALEKFPSSAFITLACGPRPRPRPPASSTRPSGER